MLNMDEKTLKLDASKIARPKSVIHPALDWVRDQLIVGVLLEGGNRAVLGSRDGLVEIATIGEVCERDGCFESHVTPEVAQDFLDYLDSKPKNCPKEALRETLLELSKYFSRFVDFPNKSWSNVLACWTVGTYLFPAFQAYPYVWITSAEPGCGKSLLGQLIANLAFNGEFMVSPTEANMFHLPEQNRGVQVWDELEYNNQVAKGKYQSIQAILLNGYRNGGVVPRLVGRNLDEQVRYHVYCPRVIIGLSELPETTRQRTIRLGLTQRTHEHDSALYRHSDNIEEESRLKGKCVLAALKCVPDVNQNYKDNHLRRELQNALGKAGREADDIWLPLFAIAAAAVGDSDLAQDTLLGELVESAKELSALRDGRITAAKTVLKFPGTAHAGSARIAAAGPEPGLVTALSLLRALEPIQPETLRALIYECADVRVTTQWLSKNLKRLGIQSKKHNARRVFMPSKEELERAESELRIAAAITAVGQQGHEGQQHLIKEVV
jgi:hypothetical protein